MAARAPAAPFMGVTPVFGWSSALTFSSMMTNRNSTMIAPA